MRLFHVRVTARVPIAPRMLRVSLAGDDLADFVGDGPDQRVKLLLPREGQDRPQVTYGMTPADLLALPEEVRPVMRTYTIRRHRPRSGEVDIDFAVHDGPGPATRWAVGAQPGDRAALYGPISAYSPTPGTDWQLLAGDKTALPAICAIVESLPPDTPARVFAEVDDLECSGLLRDGERTQVTWCRRAAGERLLASIRAADLPRGRPYAWVAGERSQVADVRRHLVEERGIDRDDVYFSGYWRIGKAEGQA
ncbi:siderophore-interacting protein [Actinoallomurus acaciae]|uniref:Siderophore-interacting protein n=1 Tax=Actinoallomurus acaciae TaxID=502577 RepID=A0ABV5YJI5_9ACTN